MDASQGSVCHEEDGFLDQSHLVQLDSDRSGVPAVSSSLDAVYCFYGADIFDSYNVFLPDYLKSRGAQVGGLSPGMQWAYYAAANLCSIPSPILAGYMCKSRFFWGRRGTMIM